MYQKSEKGFSLLEVVLSMSLLGITTAGIVPAFLGHFSAMTQNEVRTGAVAAAQQVLDRFRTLDPSDFPTNGSTGPEQVTAGSKEYSVTTSYCVDVSLCVSANTRHVTIGVTYNGSSVYQVETVFTKLK